MSSTPPPARPLVHGNLSAKQVTKEEGRRWPKGNMETPPATNNPAHVIAIGKDMMGPQTFMVNGTKITVTREVDPNTGKVTHVIKHNNPKKPHTTTLSSTRLSTSITPVSQSNGPFKSKVNAQPKILLEAYDGSGKAEWWKNRLDLKEKFQKMETMTFLDKRLIVKSMAEKVLFDRYKPLSANDPGVFNILSGFAEQMTDLCMSKESPDTMDAINLGSSWANDLKSELDDEAIERNLCIKMGNEKNPFFETVLHCALSEEASMANLPAKWIPGPKNAQTGLPQAPTKLTLAEYILKSGDAEVQSRRLQEHAWYSQELRKQSSLEWTLGRLSESAVALMEGGDLETVVKKAKALLDFDAKRKVINAAKAA